MKVRDFRTLLQPLDTVQPLDFCIDTDEFEMWTEQVTHYELQGACSGQACLVVYEAGSNEKKPTHEPCTPSVLLVLLQNMLDDQQIELCIVSDETRMWSGPILSVGVKTSSTGQTVIVAECDIDEINEEDVGPAFGNPEWDNMEITVRGPKIH